MPFSIKNRVDEGANGVLYKGDDGLGRDVAIKLINESSAQSNFILDQAKALAKVKSPHVVEVIVIQGFDDPEKPGTTRQGIVMEWLDGKTLLDITNGPLISTDDAKRIGIGMIDGLVAIHQSGLAHTDLHARNVMVGAGFVKILDIQYYNSLRDDTPTGKAAKLNRDRECLADLIRQVLHKAQTPADKVTAFNAVISSDDSLDEIRTAFEAATGSTGAAELQRQVETIYGRFTNAKFVDTQEYATILADATPDAVIRPLIEMILAKGTADRDRRKYLRAIWSRLGPEDRTAIGAQLGEALDRNIPEGSPGPHLNMLTAFGESGWNSVPPINRIPLERALLNDMRLGRRNAYHGFGAGHLGTWCINFYPYFSDQQSMLDNVMHLLRVRWDGQNYIGERFMRVLDDLPSNDEEREKLTKAIVGALEDDASFVKLNINKLPEAWRTEIQSRVKQLP